MVDIHEKSITHRKATASGIIRFSNNVAASLIEQDSNKKGDVLGVSRISGIMAVKNTSQLIPLCHPISITKIKVTLELDSKNNSVTSECTVECEGKTGVEMEALTGCTVSLLTVYDMCKAVDKDMIISEVQVTEKRGGKADYTSSRNS
ncbi:hypothetical protein LJB42_002599 [Komagataella kurtzmanii]|nr:hypothetical protein LJB42_002599 [Komagataella kurtzmanii]